MTKKQSSKEFKEYDLPDGLENPEKLSPILEDPSLSEEAKENIIRAFISRKETFSGPLPPPKVLADYGDIIKNGAERIMQMAEKQTNHRIEMEKRVISDEIIQSGRGQWLGFILGVLGLGLATWLAYMGHDAVAGVFGTTTIVGLVAVFVIGKKVQQNNTDQSE